MSFYSQIMPELRKKSTDEEWYLRVLTKSLNKWFIELEKEFGIIIQPIDGTGSLPNGFTISITHVPCMKLVPNGIRFTFNEIKNVMWGDNKKLDNEDAIHAAAELSFAKLFRLIGKKIAKNWTSATGGNNFYAVFNGSTLMPTMWDTNHFYATGIAFFKAAQKSNMTPELFHSLLNTYLALAINTTNILTVPVSGTYAYTYAFTGTASLKFPPVS